MPADPVLIGIDPSLRGTGIVGLHVGPMVRVLYAHTVREPTRQADLSLAVRLHKLHDSMVASLRACYDQCVKRARIPDRIIIEDPTDFSAGWGGSRMRRSSDIAKTGAAFATAVMAARGNLGAWSIDGGPVAIPTHDWLPRDRNARGGTHFMKHDKAIAQLRTIYPALRELKDDEVMAAGVALWWHRRGR